MQEEDRVLSQAEFQELLESQLLRLSDAHTISAIRARMQGKEGFTASQAARFVAAIDQMALPTQEGIQQQAIEERTLRSKERGH
jgi:hypothetical protein